VVGSLEGDVISTRCSTTPSMNIQHTNDTKLMKKSIATVTPIYYDKI
jgi:hypothetical protein